MNALEKKELREHSGDADPGLASPLFEVFDKQLSM